MDSPTRLVLMTPEVLDEVVTLFFDAGFNGGFKEASEGEMYLPEDDPTAVADLIEYLYRGSLPHYTEEDGSNEKVRNLYYLAEKIGMSSLMDKLMDMIAVPRIRRTGNLIGYGPWAIKAVYDHTHEESKLRLFVSAVNVFKLGHQGNNKDWMDNRAKLLHSNPEFFHDMFKLLGKHGKQVWVKKSDDKAFVAAFERCYFHVHGPDEECYAKLDDENQVDSEEGTESEGADTSD